MSDNRKMIHDEIASATVKIFVYGDFMGTGFFITQAGYILTAFHCIKGDPIPKRDDVEIETSSGKKFNAQIDLDKSVSEVDIAVLKVDYHPKNYLPLGSVLEQQATDDVVILGYPAGHRPENQKISTVIGRITKVEGNYIQSDAVEGKGQSGRSVYHYDSNKVIGLVSFGYEPNILPNLGMIVRFDKLFEQWLEIMPLSERLSRFIHKITDKRLTIRLIWKEVTKYLTRLKKMGINEEDKYILLDI
jgi:S1-C subfamily serine protease